MPSLMEVIDLTMLGVAVSALVINVIRIKKKRKSKQSYENKKDLR